MVKKEEKIQRKQNTIKAELGDNLFVLLCLANSMGIDMTESFNETMKKFNTRDKKSIRKESEYKNICFYLDLIKIKNIHQ